MEAPIIYVGEEIRGGKFISRHGAYKPMRKPHWTAPHKHIKLQVDDYIDIHLFYVYENNIYN